MVIRSLELHLFGECEPLPPTYWWRYSHFSDPNLLHVDDQIESPNSLLIGLAVCVDTSKRVSLELDDLFVPRASFQSVVVLWNDKYYAAAIKGLNYPIEMQVDLKSVHGIESDKVIREIYEADTERWLNGSQL